MKCFRSYVPEQSLLLPASLEDWLPEGHLARFVSEVVEELDLSEVYASYQDDGRGQAAYHPLLMTRVLVYGYCTGKVSSRRIERACWEEVAFRYLAANQQPDHDTIATFRRRHLAALAGLFVQVLRLCQKAGLLKLGQVAIDGTKLQANASRYQNQSYEKLGEEERRLREQVEQILEEAERVDAAEDAKYGRGRRGDELPAELASRESRLKKIREAKASLEREAREQAERKRKEAEQAWAERQHRAEPSGRRPSGRRPKMPDPEQARPKPGTAGNATDPDSRLMKSNASRSFVQAYNAQAAVDGDQQIIVAAEVVQDRCDRHQLVPMIEQVQRNTGQVPEKVTADTDYYRPRPVQQVQGLGVDLYLKPDRPPHAARGAPARPTVAEGLRQKLRTPEGGAIYRKRRETVEPVFGQIKQARGFRNFLFRGLAKVRAEWKLICLTHNLLKLYRWGWQPA